MARIGIRKTALSLAVAGAFAGSVSQAHAAAFALIEQNANGLGNSYAGAAAAAEDASTIYYNPAGMSLLPAGMQVSAGLALIKPTAKFTDSGSVASGTGLGGVNPAGPRPLGGDGGDAGSLSGVPNAYFAMDLTRDFKFGVGLSVPFGLKTEYEPDWVGRFQGIKSEISTVNLNPSISYRLDDKTSFGFGLSYQQLDAELTSAINYIAATAGTGNLAAAAAIPAGNAEGTVVVKGSDNALGFNLGAMFQLAPDTRLGVSYRSSIKYHVTGTVSFSNVPAVVAAGFPDGNVKLDITLPDSASVALHHKLDPKWTLLGDVTWTGWSKIKELKIERDSGATLQNTPENFKNTWRVGVGATYRYDDAWSIKMGVAYDQTPVNDTDRTVRLPDQDRLWLSVGGQYKVSKDGTLDFGYAHLFVKEASINQNAGSTTGFGLVSGTYKGSVDILGVQFAYRF